MTQLPEPNFIERDAEQITKAWIDLYESKTGKALQPAQIERLIIDSGAYRENLLRVEIQRIAKENLLSYAPLDILEHIGEPLGVTKLLASAAKTTLRFKVDSVLDFDCAIPTGVEVETKDGLFTFVTTESAILIKNTLYVDIPAQCSVSGIAGNNYIVNSINNLITPLPYISEVSNISVSAGGADDENAESLRNRIRQAPEKFSNAGSRGAYRYHTLSAHQSIIDVAISSPSAGVVNIYPLTENGNPNSEIINIVKNYLSDEKIRPLTDQVKVYSPEKVSFTINASLTLFKDSDSTSVLSTIENKLNEYKLQLAQTLGKSIIKTQIIAILNSVYGVYKVILNSPQNDVIVNQNQWSDLTSWNISIGGYANE